MNAIERNIWHLTWGDIGQEILRKYGAPQLILCISAHWVSSKEWFVSAAPQPSTMHDFAGFPAELYRTHYPAPGAPQMAEELAAWLSAPHTGKPLALDNERGLDHGAWSVLLPMFPEAQIPVLQLSMFYGRTPQEHWALGQQLAALRDWGVLILGSGNMVHNLGLTRWGTGINATYTWALEFEERICRCLQGQYGAQLSGLMHFERWEEGELLELSHPSTHEHYLPLLYSAAAVRAGDRLRFFNAGFQAASISMRSVIWESIAAV